MRLLFFHPAFEWSERDFGKEIGWDDFIEVMGATEHIVEMFSDTPTQAEVIFEEITRVVLLERNGFCRIHPRYKGSDAKYSNENVAFSRRHRAAQRPKLFVGSAPFTRKMERFGRGLVRVKLPERLSEENDKFELHVGVFIPTDKFSSDRHVQQDLLSAIGGYHERLMGHLQGALSDEIGDLWSSYVCYDRCKNPVDIFSDPEDFRECVIRHHRPLEAGLI